MSNSLAIGAVTATLRNLLDNGISAEGGGLHTTTLPPEKAQTFGQAIEIAERIRFLQIEQCACR